MGTCLQRRRAYILPSGFVEKRNPLDIKNTNSSFTCHLTELVSLVKCYKTIESIQSTKNGVVSHLLGCQSTSCCTPLRECGKANATS